MTAARVAYRIRVGLVALLCGATLAACGIPRSSEVLDGRRVGDNLAPRARIVVDPPAVGSSPVTIARDFIRSGAFQETGDDQQVVGRSYLAPGSVDLWRPIALTTTVFDSKTPLKIDSLPSDQVRLTITAVATIDETGHYRELPENPTWRGEREHAWYVLQKSRPNWWEPGSTDLSSDTIGFRTTHLFFRIEIEVISGRRASG